MKIRNGCSLFLLLSLAIFGPSGSIHAQETAKPAQTNADEFTSTMKQARTYLVSGQVNEAIAAYRKAAALKNGDCAECFQYLGQIYFQMTRYNEAAAVFRQAVALKPQNEAALANFLGVALYLQDDKKSLAEAVDVFRHAIELSGDKIPKAHYNRGHALMKLGRAAEGIAEFKRFLEMEPNAESAQEVRAIVANPKLAGAKFAADFNVKDATGAPISLTSLRGKIVLLDFWAVWCGPCRAEMPSVKRIAKKYAGEPLVILGISLDRDRKAFEEYQKLEGMNWPQFYDGKGWGNQVAQLYKVNRIPHTVLIDQDGIIRATGLRGEQLSNKIGELLKQLQAQQTTGRK